MPFLNALSLYAIALVVPLITFRGFTNPIVIKQAAMAAAGLFCVMRALSLPKRIVFPKSITWLVSCVVAWLGWSWISFITGTHGYGDRTWLLTFTILAPVLLMVLADRLRSQKMMESINFFFLFTVGIVAIVAILQYLGFEQAGYEYRARKISSTLGNHNNLTGFLAGTLFYALSFTKGKKSKPYAGGAALVAFLALLLTQSRLASAGIAVGTLGVVFFTLTSSKIKPIMLCLIVIAGTMASMVLLTLPVFEKIDHTRAKIAQSSWKMISTAPFWGKGTGSFLHRFQEFQDLSLNTKWQEPAEDWKKTGPVSAVVGHTHNQPLMFLAEQGIVGLAAFLSVLAIFLFIFFRAGCLATGIAKWQLAFRFGAVAALLTAGLVTPFLHSVPGLCLCSFIGLQIIFDATPPDKAPGFAVPRTGFVVVLGCVLLLGSTGLIRDVLVDHYIQKALSLIEHDELKGALGYLDNAQRLDSRNLDIPYRRGYLYHKLGQYDKAVKDYRFVMEQAPYYVRVEQNLASALYGLGQWQESLVHFKKALAISPKNPKLYYNIASTAYFLGDIHQAQIYCDSLYLVQPLGVKRSEQLRKAISARLGQQDTTQN